MCGATLTLRIGTTICLKLLPILAIALQVAAWHKDALTGNAELWCQQAADIHLIVQLIKETEMFTNRLFNISLGVVLLVLVAIRSVMSFAHADEKASGSFVTTSTSYSETQDKFNTIVDMRSLITYSGALEGTSTLEGTLTVHHDGGGNFQGVETFTGLVDGTPGTLTFKVVGNSDLYQGIELTNLIIGGTGDLAGLRGVISKTGIIKDKGPVGTYKDQIEYE